MTQYQIYVYVTNGSGIITF